MMLNGGLITDLGVKLWAMMLGYEIELGAWSGVVVGYISVWIGLRGGLALEGWIWGVDDLRGRYVKYYLSSRW